MRINKNLDYKIQVLKRYRPFAKDITNCSKINEKIKKTEPFKKNKTFIFFNFLNASLLKNGLFIYKKSILSMCFLFLKWDVFKSKNRIKKEFINLNIADQKYLMQLHHFFLFKTKSLAKRKVLSDQNSTHKLNSKENLFVFFCSQILIKIKSKHPIN